MKISFFLSILALAVLGIPIPQPSSETEAAAAASIDLTSTNGLNLKSSKLDREIEAIRKEWNVHGLAVGVVYKGKLVYKKGFGTKDGGKAKVSEKTLFQIGSCTKTFTSFAIAQLVDQKKLDWNTPVTSVYPVEFADPVANAEASLLDILSHRSGFAEPAALFYAWSDWNNIATRIKDISAPVQLRQEYMYSNIMVSLAGNIGGKVSGLVGGWDELVTRNIFAPIGMNGTYSNARIVPADADYSKGFHFVDGKLKAYAVNDTFATDSCHPAGAIVSNVEDLAKWVGVINRQGVLANGSSLVTQKQFKQLTKPRIFVDKVSVGEDFKSYGLGWQLASYRGKVNVGHGGSTAGYMAEIDTFPNDDLAIIVSSNMDASYVPKLISRWITDQILFPSVQFDWSKHYQNVTLKQAMANEKDAADMLRDRIPNSVPSLPFTMYEGQFDSPTFGSITLKLYDFENHYYRMEWRGEKGGRVKMRGVMGHWELDTFGLYEFTVAEYKNYTVPTLPVMFSQDGKQFEIPMSEFTVGTFIRIKRITTIKT